MIFVYKAKRKCMNYTFSFILQFNKRKEKQPMQDISNQLTQIIKDKKCSSLVAFIMIRDGVCLQESKSNKESRRGLCDKRDINTHR